jgi:hypothetical protein
MLMSATGLEVFDTTVQKTNVWLKDLMEVMGGDRRKAYQALRASGRLRHSHVWRISPLCKSECATPAVSLMALD